jgi:hypothetical protein
VGAVRVDLPPLIRHRRPDGRKVPQTVVAKAFFLRWRLSVNQERRP